MRAVLESLELETKLLSLGMIHKIYTGFLLGLNTEMDNISDSILTTIISAELSLCESMSSVRGFWVQFNES